MSRHHEYAPHTTAECFAVIYWSRCLLRKNDRHFEHIDEICEQLWAERRIMRTPEYKLIGGRR